MLNLEAELELELLPPALFLFLLGDVKKMSEIAGTVKMGLLPHEKIVKDDGAEGVPDKGHFSLEPFVLPLLVQFTVVFVSLISYLL